MGSILFKPCQSASATTTSTLRSSRSWTPPSSVTSAGRSSSGPDTSCTAQARLYLILLCLSMDQSFNMDFTLHYTLLLMDHLNLRLPRDHPISFFHLSPPLPSWTRPFINRVELNGPPQTPATTWERDMTKGGKISRSVRSPSAVSLSTRRASQDQTTRN